MTQQVRAFLPRCALTSERVNGVLGSAIESWSDAFFGGTRAGIRLRSDRDAAAVPSERKLGSEAVIVLTGPGKRRLLEVALGESLDGKTLSPEDHSLLDAFATGLTSELTGRIDGALSATGGPVLHLELMIDGMVIGHMELSSEAIAGKIRASIPQRLAKTAFASTLLEALADEPVEVEASLGRLELTVHDATGLEVGDVLVLDCAVNSSIAVNLVKADRPLAVGGLSSRQGHNAITLD